MPNFEYKMRDSAGNLSTGMLQAESADAASAALRERGGYVVALNVASDDDRMADAASGPKPRGKIKRSDVISFSHQLAVMIDTGVPISEALECVFEQTDNPAFCHVLGKVSDHVKAGGELSVALSQHPKVFPRVMISLIKASEASGTMGQMLERISVYLSKEHQTIRTVRGALTYPAVMLSMVVLVTVFLLAFVMPRFAGVYQQRGADLPAPTQILMDLSHSLIHQWYLWVGAAVFLIVGMVVTMRIDAGKQLIDSLKLKMPVIGPIFRKLYITRSCRTMGTMLTAGVPILDMVTIVRNVTPNRLYEAFWDDVDDRLQRGSQLSEPLFATTLFPRSVGQMIHAGEKSGRLGETLEKIAHYTEEEFDDQVKQSTQYIEPALVVAMGSIIGFVAIALLLPIFSVGGAMAG